MNMNWFSYDLKIVFCLNMNWFHHNPPWNMVSEYELNPPWNLVSEYELNPPQFSGVWIWAAWIQCLKIVFLHVIVKTWSRVFRSGDCELSLHSDYGLSSHSCFLAKLTIIMLFAVLRPPKYYDLKAVYINNLCDGNQNVFLPHISSHDFVWKI